jgi:hypothetical protein
LSFVDTVYSTGRAFPFIYSGDGAAHSAKGAWIAKQ